MSENIEFKSRRDGARLGSGPKPHKSDASGADALAYLRSVLADKTAPTTTRTKAAIEVLKQEALERERAEERRIAAYNAKQMRRAGL